MIWKVSVVSLGTKSIFQIQNEWLRNVGILWCLLGCYRVGTAIYSGSSLSGTGFWLLIGLVCIVWYTLSKTKSSIFKTDAGNIFVIQSKNHDQIITEIKTRKKQQLLRWYGEIDLENELEHEINKFNWLADQNVITKEQAQQRIAQVELAHTQESPEQERLN